jgi:hypothetical protein
VAGCYFGGMRRFVFPIVFVPVLLVCALAEDAIQGTFVGDWSGATGAGGTFKLLVERESGKSTCTVSFQYEDEEVKTNVTLCKTDGPKIEAQYDFDLGGNRLQSTIHGQRKGNALDGKYHTKALESGTAVDEGDWKAAPAQ